MRTISIHEVRGVAPSYNTGTNPVLKETVVGLRAEIVPRVDLNPEAVQGYVMAGRLAGGSIEESRGLSHAKLLGNTDEATIVYAGVVLPSDEQARNKELLANRVVEYLGLMGMEAQVLRS